MTEDGFYFNETYTKDLIQKIKVEKGPSIHLFTKEFFKKVSRILMEDGVYLLQAGSADIRGLFALPLYLERAMKNGDILIDKDPLIWEL